MKLISIFEDINAKDAHSESGSLSTVLSGERNIGFLTVDRSMIEALEKHHIKIIPVRMVDTNSIKSIIYREESKQDALRLYQIAKSKDDRLKDSTPEEAREIGKLLGYSENSINNYIWDKYHKNAPSDNPDDYDDLQENTSIQLNKKVIEVVKDEKGKDVKICTVNGEYVKGTNPGLDFIQFVEGGHHYVDSYPGYKKNIPEDEIWVDEVFYKTPENFQGIVGHEFKERNNMKYHKMSYDKAHDLSNTAEKRFRNKKDKLHENFQFNKITDLIKGVI